MTEFALLNIAEDDGTATPALKVRDHVVCLAQGFSLAGIDVPSLPTSSTKEVLRNWPVAESALYKLAAAFERDAAAFAAAEKPLASVRLLAPILYPDAIFCAFANYTDHMKEMSGREPPDKTVVKPYFFLKLAAHSIVGPDAEVKLPAYSSKVDWEAELAVVIGRSARNVPVDQAMDYVAGYTIMNDLSLRDQDTRTDWNVRYDFLSGKSFDGGAPMGPWIVPAKQIPNVYDLSIKQWVDRDLMQDSTTGCMHFSIAEQIAYLSAKFTLRPGDVIATGSPAGNGRPRGVYLKPGQELTVEIEGIGRLQNPLVQGE